MTARELLSPLNILLVLAFAAVTVVGFVLVPTGTVLPVHWGISGEPDGFLPRDAALLMLPGISVLVLGLLMLVQRLSSEARRQASRYVVLVTVSALLALFLAIPTATVMIGSGVAGDMVRVVVLGVGLLFVVLGNILPKSQPNWIAGIRIPSTLRDTGNWQATHRLGGLLMMLGGAAIAVAALITGDSIVLLAVTLTGLLLPFIIATVYSMRRASHG
jgi:uncharacterized membrane protein